MNRRKLPIAPSPNEAALPPLYARWADALLDAPIPEETVATCASCAMEGQAGATAFDPKTKCCTFQPTLANFLVGAILADTDGSSAARQGRETVRARVAVGAGVTPLGLARSERFRALYATTGHGDAFGNAHSLRCPHYVERGGLCGVWRHRESTCATWFCKHDRGAVGHAFWRALQALLLAGESALARHALLVLDPGPDALAELARSHAHIDPTPRLDAADVDERRDPVRHRALWGRWLGREEEYFVECARLTASLAWPDVLALGGADLALHARVVKDAFATLLDERVPARVRVHRYEVAAVTAETTRVSTYSKYDPLELPNELVELLPYFDGRPTRRALAEIERRRGVALDVDTVRQLVDYEVLVPV